MPLGQSNFQPGLLRNRRVKKKRSSRERRDGRELAVDSQRENENTPSVFGLVVVGNAIDGLSHVP